VESAVLRKHGGRIGEMYRRLSVPQSSEGDHAALGGGLGRADGEAVESAPLLRFDIGEQRIRFGQLAFINGLLRVRLQGCNSGVVARLN
jgi:hypothetical protein